MKQLLLAPSAEEIIKQLNVIRGTLPAILYFYTFLCAYVLWITRLLWNLAVVKALEVKDAGDSTSNEIGELSPVILRFVSRH